MRDIKLNPTPETLTLVLTDDGIFPNNAHLPLVVYHSPFVGGVTTDVISHMFAGNHWGGNWINGIYSIHYYHSTTHEVLGIANGKARVQFGGPEGSILDVSAGEVVVIPAGVAHKLIHSDAGFVVVGGYPDHHFPDMKTGQLHVRPDADRNVLAVKSPSTDPLYGHMGPLIKIWKINQMED